MKKRLTLISMFLLLVFALSSGIALADYVTSWSFGTFNNPNARQVALNIANRQLELAEEDDAEKTAMERFQESLERMQMSKAVQDLIYFNPDENENEGFLPLGDSWLYYRYEDDVLTVWYWESGQWVETPILPGNQPPKP